MNAILGYWLESETNIYFARDVRDVAPEHVGAFNGKSKGVVVTPVTNLAEVAPYVILRHIKKGVIIATRWTPQSPVPLEHDHTGKVAFQVVDFAEDQAEADAICNELRKERKTANV